MSRARNGGVEPWGPLEGLIADLWALWAKKDHPTRVERAAKAKREQKQAKVGALKTKYQGLKRKYGLG